jgi:naphthalene 1,2-dioxygenase subunit beta
LADEHVVPVELHYEAERFLHMEARLLDRGMLREWLEQMVDPQIAYRMVIREERFLRDKRAAGAGEVRPLDDDHAALDLRVRQVETGLRSMLDPPEKLRRYVTNVETWHGDGNGEIRVHSYGLVTRNRRLTEREQIEYGREDVLRRGPDGRLRLLSRLVEIDPRVVQAKNLLFFL